MHVNEPGRTEWEGFTTATRAAAAGGVTTLVDMPLNCIPVTTTGAALETKRAACANQLAVDVGFWGGVIPGNAGDLPGLARAGVLGCKAFLIHSGIDEFPNASEGDLRRAMPVLRGLGLPLLAHAELDVGAAAPDGHAHADAHGDPRSYDAYLASRPRAWEDAAIRLLIALCRETGCAVHIVHLSSASSLPALRAAKDEGLPITVETCPHYLCFEAEAIPDGATHFKCAPPIREHENREALWRALGDGTIDLVISDHSPCTPALKVPERGDFQQAWGGIASLQLGLAAVWTEARRRGHGLADIAAWMSERPARLAGLAARKGRIAPGLDADLVVWDPDEEHVVAARGAAVPAQDLALRRPRARRPRAPDDPARPGRLRRRRAGGHRARCDLARTRPRELDHERARGGRIHRPRRSRGGGARWSRARRQRRLLRRRREPDSSRGAASSSTGATPIAANGWTAGRAAAVARRARGPTVIAIGACSSWARPARCSGFDVDTNHFLGNHPPFASIDGLTAPAGLATPASTPLAALAARTDWVELLAQSPLRPGSQNLFAAIARAPVSHVRLKIFPDGGVARLRVFGRVAARWQAASAAADPETAPHVAPDAVDLAAVRNGGLALACSDAFFGPMNNLLLPGRSADMSGGWETRRRRGPGHDWILIKLGAPGTVDVLEVDTNHFKGNYPDRCAVDAIAAPDARITDLIASPAWAPILPETKLRAHERHFFATSGAGTAGPATHLRLSIFPDGGVSRLRAWGRRHG